MANANLWSSDTDKNMTADILLTYMAHPGTALYVGYTDNYQNMVLNASAPNGWSRSAESDDDRAPVLREAQLYVPVLAFACCCRVGEVTNL